MNYNQTLEFLFNQLPAYHRIGKAAYKNNLDNTLALDEHTGHPHMKYKSIHIAGTNGKGSVSHMLASVLQEAGYNTGLYTSPHLIDFRERIRVNGEMIPVDTVIDFVSKQKDFIEALKPSFFEMTVAMAFDSFAKQKVEIAVIETGLGGRLDSTNIITPVLSVITNIGHDHMDLLGNTLSDIAVEKAGIIKCGVPAVIGETQKETSAVFISKAAETRSEIKFADQNFSCIIEEDNITSGEWKFIISDKKGDESLRGITALGGDYQMKNLVTLFQSLKSLDGILNISPDNISAGIKKVIINTGFSGRWQVLGRNPLIICDTGHNKEGLEYVMNQIGTIPKKRLHIIIGFVNDKDLSLVLPLFPQNAVYYFTKASVYRALDEKTLKDRSEAYGLRGYSYPDVKTAMKVATDEADRDDLIFIGGSTFIVADALKSIFGLRDSPNE